MPGHSPSAPLMAKPLSHLINVVSNVGELYLKQVPDVLFWFKSPEMCLFIMKYCFGLFYSLLFRLCCENLYARRLAAVQHCYFSYVKVMELT